MPNKRLLILDDDTDVARTIALLARHTGFEIKAAEDANQFFSLIDAWAPSHVVVDLVMPVTDGVEILRRLAAIQCRARVIVTSGIGERVLDLARRNAVARGLDIAGILPKPFEAVLLRALLAEPAGECRPGAQQRQPDARLTREDFERGLRNDEFSLHYQPKLFLASGALAGFEALARWDHPVHGLLGPDAFVPIAERLGMIGRFTEAMLDKGLDWLQGMRWLRQDGCLAINISARTVMDLSLADRIADRCDARAVPRACLMLEITETDTFSDLHEASDILTRLRIKGFHLAIDDFGIGYSSLEKLSRLPFGEIKIDKFFVSQMRDSHEQRAIVETIIGLARRLGLKTAAEGVEEFSVARLLNDMGCTAAQGYFISPPLSATSVQTWLSSRNC